MRDSRHKRFEDLFLPHFDAARNLARWLSAGDQDGADIVQEAYLRAYRSFDGFRGESARAWLLAIVRRLRLSQALAANKFFMFSVWMHDDSRFRHRTA